MTDRQKNRLNLIADDVAEVAEKMELAVNIPSSTTLHRTEVTQRLQHVKDSRVAMEAALMNMKFIQTEFELELNNMK